MMMVPAIGRRSIRLQTMSRWRQSAVRARAYEEHSILNQPSYEHRPTDSLKLPVYTTYFVPTALGARGRLRPVHHDSDTYFLCIFSQCGVCYMYGMCIWYHGFMIGDTYRYGTTPLLRTWHPLRTHRKSDCRQIAPRDILIDNYSQYNSIGYISNKIKNI